MTRWAHERPRRLGRLHTRAGRLVDFTLTEPLQRLSVGSETEAEERSPVERERWRALLEQFLAGVT